MLHHQKGIAKKRERHYRESRILFSVALVTIGIILIVLLAIVWPQYLLPRIFNSKLLFKLTIDRDDYATCSKEYSQFVNYTEPSSTSTFNFFIYNVTNPAAVIERGERPYLVEIGPFSYQMHRYKYDVSFDKHDFSTISYKEYSTLTPVLYDNKSCSRPYLEESSSCSTSTCSCKNEEEPVTVANPLFSKLLWSEGGSSIIAELSLEVFQNIKKMLETE
jgi:CD36 family